MTSTPVILPPNRDLRDLEHFTLAKHFILSFLLFFSCFVSLFRVYERNWKKRATERTSRDAETVRRVPKKGRRR